jgi:hypothetical protein
VVDDELKYPLVTSLTLDVIISIVMILRSLPINNVAFLVFAYLNCFMLLLSDFGTRTRRGSVPLPPHSNPVPRLQSRLKMYELHFYPTVRRTFLEEVQ